MNSNISLNNHTEATSKEYNWEIVAKTFKGKDI